MKKALISLAVCALACHAPAWSLVPVPTGDCQLRIDSPTASWIISGYDPFGGNVPVAQFDVTFRNEGTGECRFMTGLSLPNETFGLTDGSAPAIPYTVIDRFSSADISPVAGSTPISLSRRQVVLAGGQQQIVPFQLSVEPSLLRRDGMFSQHAVLEAVQSDGQFIFGQPILLGIEVQPSARVGLSGAFTISGGRPVVNLGELAEGPVELPLRLRVQSTRRYRLSFNSLHQGNLQLGETNWRIPYSIIVDSTTIPLAGGNGQFLDQGIGNYHEDALPLGFVIGNTGAQRAGTYSDVLTISVAPQ